MLIMYNPPFSPSSKPPPNDPIITFPISSSPPNDYQNNPFLFYQTIPHNPLPLFYLINPYQTTHFTFFSLLPNDTHTPCYPFLPYRTVPHTPSTTHTNLFSHRLRANSSTRWWSNNILSSCKNRTGRSEWSVLSRQETRP